MRWEGWVWKYGLVVFGMFISFLGGVLFVVFFWCFFKIRVSGLLFFILFCGERDLCYICVFLYIGSLVSLLFLGNCFWSLVDVVGLCV